MVGGGWSRGAEYCVLPGTVVLIALWIFYAHHHHAPFQTSVDTKLAPHQANVAAHGVPQNVSASRDDKGVQTDFLDGIVLLRPKSDVELKSFLDRYQGTVVGDDTIPEPPPELGMHLSAEDRKPTEFKIRIPMNDDYVGRVQSNSAAAGLTGGISFSSRGGLQTFARVIDAAASGFRVSGDFVDQSQQSFPVTLLTMQENSGADPFSNSAYADYGGTGNVSNVLLAWQFIAAHGIKRRATVAIVDNGFYLDGNGLARGSDSDFQSVGKPMQYDIDFNDAFAGDAGDGQCGGQACFWHGTGAAGAAIGVANNGKGGAGSGGFVVDPMVLRTNSTDDEHRLGVRVAVKWGADVVSMSYGKDCDVWCRMQDRADNPYDEAAAAGSKTVFVASAGNGQGNPAAGYDVGEPSFYHPCIASHVICVGGLQPGANTIISYSNFGAQVQVFAPTNIPVMSFPPSKDGAGNALPLAQADGPPVPQVFGGTSASAPFVAGIIGMMRAVNPDLSPDDIAGILRNTSHPGAGNVTRSVDAYAAVRQAAGTSPIVDDPLERNDIETDPTNLGNQPSYSKTNLNMDNHDRDYFAFNSPGGSLMTLALNRPDVLGSFAVQQFESRIGICQAPTLSGNPATTPNKQTLTYRVPGGPLLLGLRATDVNAYNMAISFTSDTYPPDIYEPNDTVPQAKHISSFRSAGIGSAFYVIDDPRVTIDATLHSNSDVDFYIIRATTLTIPDRIFVGSFASVQVYGNDSLINLQVFHMNPGPALGGQVGNVNGAVCAPKPLEVRLDEGGYYLVKVTGSAGRYTLRNGIGGSPPHIPEKEHDQLYVVLHPGDPIEHVIRFPEVAVLTPSQEFSGLQLEGQNAHMALFDTTGKLVSSGVAGQNGETLSLASADIGSTYFLEFTPTNVNATQTTKVAWLPAKPLRTSDNLISNPGAEIGNQNANGELPGWQRIDGLAAPLAIPYSDNGQSASPTGPGSKERGLRLFVGGLAPGQKATTSGLQQRISLDDGWQKAVDAGHVTARLSAFLGGSVQTPKLADVSVALLDAGGRRLSSLVLPTVSAVERGGQAGLLPVDISDSVPQGTRSMVVNLTFTGNDRNIDRQAYADNLQLVLTQE
jgi:hypothetical protein